VAGWRVEQNEESFEVNSMLTNRPKTKILVDGGDLDETPDQKLARVCGWPDRTSVDAYPKWQAWMREKQPRLLMIWGKYELSFDPSEPEAYRRDVPKAEVHIVNGGHFALDTAADQIAQLVRSFMK